MQKLPFLKPLLVERVGSALLFVFYKRAFLKVKRNTPQSANGHYDINYSAYKGS